MGGGVAPELSEAKGRANTLKFDIFCKQPALTFLHKPDRVEGEFRNVNALLKTASRSVVGFCAKANSKFGWVTKFIMDLDRY